MAACGLPTSDYFGPVPEVRDPRHLRYCNAGEPEGLDPAQVSSTTATPIIHTLFDGLTIYGNDGHPEPSLATGWDVSPDLRRYTFHLRHEARWSNGRPLTAYDVAYQAVRMLHPITASPSADNLDFVKNYGLFVDNRARVLLTTPAACRPGRSSSSPAPAAARSPSWSTPTSTRRRPTCGAAAPRSRCATSARRRRRHTRRCRRAPTSR